MAELENQTISPPPPARSSRGLGRVLLAVLALLVLAAVGYGGYWYGQRSVDDQPTNQPAATGEIKVPADATVTAECINGLGKQYVVPKDIPFGPIYNVHDGKVVGIEYMFNVSELTKNPSRFMALEGFKQSFDHINIDSVPTGHAGNSEPHFHVDLFTVNQPQAATITCGPEHSDAQH